MVAPTERAMILSQDRSRRRVRWLRGRDSTLANPQQVIADLQHQLAERTTEPDAALTREAAIGGTGPR